MTWMVRLATEFVDEFRGLPAPVQLELLAHARVIERFGPHTGRPRVDTLKGSRHSNMKELRFGVAGGPTGVFQHIWAAFGRRSRGSEA